MNVLPWQVELHEHALPAVTFASCPSECQCVPRAQPRLLLAAVHIVSGESARFARLRLRKQGHGGCSIRRRRFGRCRCRRLFSASVTVVTPTTVEVSHRRGGLGISTGRGACRPGRDQQLAGEFGVAAADACDGTSIPHSRVKDRSPVLAWSLSATTSMSEPECQYQCMCLTWNNIILP